MPEHFMVEEVTLRLYQSLRIEESLYQVLRYLASFFPIDNLHVSVFNSETGTVHYLSSATRKGGLLIDEKIRLSDEGTKQTRMLIPGKVLILNRPLDTFLIREVTQARLTTADNEIIYDPGSVFSAMTLALDIGAPLLGMCTMVAEGKNLYDRTLQQRFKSLARPMNAAIMNLLHHREVLGRNEQLEQHNQDLQHRLGHLDAIQIIGAEEGLREVMVRSAQVAGTDTPVLITGETGTGKEVMAHAIHRMSTRRDGPMVCINCGAIASTLVDSELFGHEKGAFTGATAKKRGYFEQASGGTIFLDEIGELPESVQVKLLRVIEEKTLYRVGGHQPISVSPRIIAATHRNLPDLVSERRFREDLWFRLNVFPIHLPPLRERRMDIPALVDHFLGRKAREMHLPFAPRLAQGAMGRLTTHDWPGNIRELENLIERSLITCDGRPITFTDLFPTQKAAPTASTPDDPTGTLEAVIISHIQKTLDACDGKISGTGGAAERLGLNPSTLRGKMRKYGMG